MFNKQRHILIAVSVASLLCLVGALSIFQLVTNTAETSRIGNQSNQPGLSSSQSSSENDFGSKEQSDLLPKNKKESTPQLNPDSTLPASRIPSNSSDGETNSNVNTSQGQTSTVSTPQAGKSNPSTTPNPKQRVSPTKIECNVYVLPIGESSNQSFQVVVISKSGFTARVSIMWAKITETITLDVVGGSASALVSGEQVQQPDVFVYALPDTSTEACSSLKP